MRLPGSHASSWGCSPMTAPHCAPTRSSMVMPTVHPSWRACATIWSVVCLTFGRLILGIASISAALSKSFMPIGMLRSRRYWLSPPMIASQSYVSVVTLVSLRLTSLLRIRGRGVGGQAHDHLAEVVAGEEAEEGLGRVLDAL